MVYRPTWKSGIGLGNPPTGIRPPDPPSIPRTPRNDAEKQKLLQERPGGWCYLLFAAELGIGRDGLETRFLEYDIGYTPPMRPSVAEADAAPFVGEVCSEARLLLGNFLKLALPEVQERVLGRADEADPKAVSHMAGLWTSTYAGLLDCALRVRATPRPARWDKAFRLLERMLDGPIREYRRFVDEIVERTDAVPEAVAHGRKLHRRVTIRLRFDEKVAAEFMAEIARNTA